MARVVRATGHSLDGLRAAYRGEAAFRVEVGFAIVLLPAALLIGSSWLERAVLAGSVLLVLIVELLNSAIEAAVDRVSLDLHDLSKRAKDLGSAAVCLSLVACGGTWALAIGHRLFGHLVA